MKRILLAFLTVSAAVVFAQTPPPPPGLQSISIKPNSTLGKDAMVWSNNANANYGNATAINVYTWTNSGVLGLKRSYLLFDFSQLPAGAVIDTAKLNLFYDPSTNEGFTTHSGGTVMEVRRVTGAWSESTITWNNQPTATTTNQVVVPAHSSSTQNYSIDVTTLVNDMRLTGNSNNGFQLKMQDEVNYYRGLLFASSDHTNLNLHPELSISYHIATGISEIEEDLTNALEIYPNPSEGLVNLDLNEAYQLADFQIQLLDILGNELSFKRSSNQLDLSNQAAGVYFLRLTHESGASTTKKVILR